VVNPISGLKNTADPAPQGIGLVRRQFRPVSSQKTDGAAAWLEDSGAGICQTDCLLQTGQTDQNQIPGAGTQINFIRLRDSPGCVCENGIIELEYHSLPFDYCRHYPSP
jgi:hypothetical protein